MVQVLVQREYALPAAKVWELLADFGNISWAPGIGRVEAEGSGPGMVRKIFMSEDSPPIVEELQALDHDGMALSYTIPSGNPMPVKDYRAGAKVVPLDADRCRIDWTCDAVAVGVSDEEAAEMAKGFYGMLLQWIDDHLSAK